MDDDELLILWALDGSWGWEELQIYFEEAECYHVWHGTQRDWRHTLYLTWDEEDGKFLTLKIRADWPILHVIADPMRFVPMHKTKINSNRHKGFNYGIE